ncbi:hypothetical protein PNC201_14980 [Pseudoalteromonas sp. NC201]|nr:hypothetical protein PNC201_14980 [Pseudoalteromonas sp. NC201]
MYMDVRMSMKFMDERFSSTSYLALARYEVGCSHFLNRESHGWSTLSLTGADRKRTANYT